MASQSHLRPALTVTRRRRSRIRSFLKSRR